MMEYLSDNELCLILTRLDGQSFALAKSVNRQWSRVSRTLEVRKERFMREWGMVQVNGTPRGPTLLETASLNDFVRRHTLQKGDSLAKLAVKHGCSVIDLKVTNNILTEHAIMSRKELLIRVNSREELKGQLGQVYFSVEAKREYVLVYPPDHVFEDNAETALTTSRSWLNNSDSPKADRVRKQLILMLTRKFKIQELVAEAYLAVADWDPLKAIEQYRQDEYWQEHEQR